MSRDQSQPFLPALPTLVEFLGHFNALRARAEAIDRSGEHLEAMAESLFTASQHLIVYGSLAPGKSNHHQLEGLQGEWLTGWIKGTLRDVGWGVHSGHKALEWDPMGNQIPAQWFRSPDLPAHWPRLDRFEGSDYRRILVPFHGENGVLAVGNVYVAASH